MEYMSKKYVDSSSDFLINLNTLEKEVFLYSRDLKRWRFWLISPSHLALKYVFWWLIYESHRAHFICKIELFIT